MIYAPVISVIVPCYNQAQYLDECLQSVHNQTYQDWECIVVDDGSIDDTGKVVERWVIKDRRFHYFYQTNKGVSTARNFAIDRAKGEWILPLDGDDFISVNYLQLASTHFGESSILLIHGLVKKFGVVNEIWELPDFTLEALAHRNMIANCSFYQKENWFKVKGYDEQLQHGYEDWEFWISLLKNGGSVAKINAVGLHYRITNLSRSTNLLEGDNLELTLKIIEKKHFDFFAQYLPSWHLTYESEKRLYVTLAKYNKRLIVKVINKIYDILSL